jgi:hypothetical protein
LIVCHDSFNRFFPSSHLLSVRHLFPSRVPELFEKATIFGDEAEVGDTLKQSIEFFRLSTRHHVDNIPLVDKQVIQDVNRALFLLVLAKVEDQLVLPEGLSK